VFLLETFKVFSLSYQQEKKKRKKNLTFLEEEFNLIKPKNEDEQI